MREALAIRREVLGPTDPQLAVSLNNLGFVLQEKRDLQQAEAMFREALAIDRRRLGNDHPEVAIKLVNLSRILVDQGKHEAAEPPAREAVAIRRKVLGNEPSGARQRARPVGEHPRGAEPARDRAAQAGSAGDRAPAHSARRIARRHAWRTTWHGTLFRRGAYLEAASLFSALRSRRSERPSARTMRGRKAHWAASHSR